ncbi:MAG TPA: hypothetical protein VLF69_02845 [Candidatus Saccharimonadales bacterium]|nr:hypothetical protein [Candidatus Saccharimonadales bacterium]
MLDANKDFDNRNLANSEEAIEKALEYLRYHDPANANREYAIGLLKRMQAAADNIAGKVTLDFEQFVENSNEPKQN